MRHLTDGGEGVAACGVAIKESVSANGDVGEVRGARVDLQQVAVIVVHFL